MKQALKIAQINQKFTKPNPSVAAIIVNNNEIISYGVTADGGRPHAETIAIDKAGNKTNGSTLYVTLEPCNHWGKTPPCTDKIIDSNIKKVVIAAIDNDERMCGKAIEKLKNANIEVTYNICEEEAIELNQPFFKSNLKNLPFITLKIAATLDGKIATKNGDSKWITNEKSRNFVHHLRAQNHGIITGIGTIIKDDPMLNCRINPYINLPKFARNDFPKKPVIDFSPVIIILDTNLKIPLKSNIFKNSQQIIIFHKENINTGLLSHKNNIRLYSSPLKDGLLDIIYILKKLYELGFQSILIEGGQKLNSNIMKNKLFDKLYYFQAPKIIGGDGINVFSELGINNMQDAFCLKELKTKNIGGDIVFKSLFNKYHLR